MSHVVSYAIQQSRILFTVDAIHPDRIVSRANANRVTRGNEHAYRRTKRIRRKDHIHAQGTHVWMAKTHIRTHQSLPNIICGCCCCWCWPAAALMAHVLHTHTHTTNERPCNAAQSYIHTSTHKPNNITNGVCCCCCCCCSLRTYVQRSSFCPSCLVTIYTERWYIVHVPHVYG